MAGCLAGAAVAQTNAQPGSLPERVIRQKEQLVGRILGDPAAQSRAQAAGSQEAARLLAEAQSFHAAAREAITRSDWAAADRRLNDAMWNIGRARQLAPDAAVQQKQARAQYDRLMAGIESVKESYRRHYARLASGPGAPSVQPPSQVDEALAAARALADAGRLREAIHAAEKAEQTLLAGLNRMLGARTIEYAQRFETEMEEFAFELDRNRSYADLIPVAVAELKPSDGARRLIDRYLQQNVQYREKAQDVARAGDWKSAIASLRNATTYLQRALSIAGLIAPTEAAFEDAQ